jgi:hypothetical protein
MDTEDISALEKLQYAYDFVAQTLCQTPQLHRCHLDQALLILARAIHRASRSPRLRPSPRWTNSHQPNLPF